MFDNYVLEESLKTWLDLVQILSSTFIKLFQTSQTSLPGVNPRWPDVPVSVVEYSWRWHTNTEAQTWTIMLTLEILKQRSRIDLVRDSQADEGV